MKKFWACHLTITVTEWILGRILSRCCHEVVTEHIEHHWTVTHLFVDWLDVQAVHPLGQHRLAEDRITLIRGTSTGLLDILPWVPPARAGTAPSSRQTPAPVTGGLLRCILNTLHTTLHTTRPSYMKAYASWFHSAYKSVFGWKLDGVGPVDKRPSTD